MDIGLKRIRYSGGPKQGPNKWGQEVFGNDNYDKVIREITQNSTDNPLDVEQQDAIHVKIKSFELPISEFPWFRLLKTSFENGLDFLLDSYDEQGEVCKNYKRAINLLSKEKISVLKISDYNTSGLYGDWNDKNSTLFRFFGSIGVSVEDGDGGGSRGHGKTAPFNLSKLNTCFYSSYSNKNDIDQYIYYGVSDLVFFEDNGDKFSGKIFYCDFDGKDEYKAISLENYTEASLNNIPQWMTERNEHGTDIFIIGFEPNDNDWEAEIIRAFMRNFYAAIIDKKLEVDINNFKLNSESILSDDTKKIFLNTIAKDFTLEFIDTYINGVKKYKELPGLGNCSVHVLRKDQYCRKIDMMRSRQMKIYEIRKNTWASYDYAAVFCCRSIEGSKILRKMEGSTHTAWDYKKIKNGRKYYEEYRDFIRDAVYEIAGSVDGDDEEVNIEDILFTGIGDIAEGKNGLSEKETKVETARQIPVEPIDKIILNVGDGDIVISSDGKAKKRKRNKKKSEGEIRTPDSREVERTNRRTNKIKRSYKIEDFNFVVIRNEESQCFDLHIDNRSKEVKRISEIIFDVPDENGKGLGIKLIKRVLDQNMNDISMVTENCYGPFKVNEGGNLFKIFPIELNVLLKIK